MRFGRRVTALAAGCGALTLLLTGQEMMEALVFRAEPVRASWWLAASAAIQQILLPVLLWHVLGGRETTGEARPRDPGREGPLYDVNIPLERRKT